MRFPSARERLRRAAARPKIRAATCGADVVARMPVPGACKAPTAVIRAANVPHELHVAQDSPSAARRGAQLSDDHQDRRQMARRGCRRRATSRASEKASSTTRNTSASKQGIKLCVSRHKSGRTTGRLVGFRFSHLYSQYSCDRQYSLCNPSHCGEAPAPGRLCSSRMLVIGRVPHCAACSRPTAHACTWRRPSSSFGNTQFGAGWYRNHRWRLQFWR